MTLEPPGPEIVRNGSALPKPARTFPIRKVLILVAGGLVVLAAALAFGHWWTIGRFIEQTDDAFVDGDITLLASKVPGFVAEVLVTDNQFVHAGELLVRLEDADYQAKLGKAAAMIEAQKAALTNLDAAADLQLALIEQARALANAAGTEKWRANADATRSEHLAKSHVVSEQDSEQIAAVSAKADAGVAAAQAGLLAAQRQLMVIATQKKQTQAALAEAEAEGKLARLDLGYTEIRSPIDGFIGNRQARVGAYAPVGSRLLSVVPAEGLWVEANFKESQLAHFRPGQPVRLTADVLPGVTFSGHVTSLAPATGAEFSLLPPENATGNFTKIVQRVPVRIQLDGDAARLGKLRPGLSVVVRVDQR